MRRYTRRKYVHRFIGIILSIMVTTGVIALASNYTDLTEHQENGTGEDWQLVLVNPWNKVPDGFSVKLKKLSDGQAVDERCFEALNEMMAACRDAGYNPVICSSYRTMSKQEYLFGNKVSRLIAAGYSKNEAAIEAAKVVALPGTSEHQLGLAVDVVDRYNQNLDSSQENTKTQQWLMENSWKYGFILRYPEGKTEITGITYEPWHYRYIGVEAAEYIFKNDLCFEEYLGLKNAAEQT